MLLNLSNHPSISWSPAQLAAAAQEYGVVLDWPFPAIDPLWLKAEIDTLAWEYCTNILKLSPLPKAVHLMGEMTFCFALVNLLKQHGLICVASTSRRVVTEKAPGNKEVLFEFAQFREY